MLPSGWYPRTAAEIAAFLSDFTAGEGRAAAAVAPHAGWFYSGRIAGRAVSALDQEVETVVVLGGHLPAGMPCLFAPEDGVRTPLGVMLIDAELRNALQKSLDGTEDRYRDNTVEVLLPMVRFFFPNAMLLWLRLPAESASFDAGRLIARTARELNRRVAVLSSADLTHYGNNYGFSPCGKGPAALRWVKEVNDARFLRAVEAGDPHEALERAGREKSCCSAGAVLGAMGFARERDLGPARLLEYGSSADVSDGAAEEPPDSFVGYAALAFE